MTDMAERPASVRLHHRCYGQGEPVLIVHGLFGSNRNWSGIAQRLAEQYRVITVDLRNHGNSEHSPHMGFEEMAGDLAGILDHYRLPRAHLIGHSLGGKVVMVCALLAPDRVSDLIVLDVAPVRYSSSMHALVAAMERLPLEEIRDRRQADNRLARDIPDDNLRRFLLQNLVRTDEGYRWRINLGAIREHLGEIADFPDFGPQARFSGPALFLHGGASAYVSDRHHGAILRYFPRARITAVADAGHWLHADQPEQVLDGIRAFLAGGNGEA